MKSKLNILRIGTKIEEEIMIRFADDIALMIETEGVIQRAIDEMEGLLNTFKININKNKIKILVCTRKSQDIIFEVYLDNHKLNQIEECSYLGSTNIVDVYDSL